jgi:beta-phosphoglucomutase-like phosphatase (HAD superfamily)
MIKCIIFDCDGTLVDSEYLCNLGLEMKLREYGIDLSAHEIMEKYLGGKLATTLQAIESEHKMTLKMILLHHIEHLFLNYLKKV